MPVRRVTPGDWAEFWPLLQGFGTDRTKEASKSLYDELLADPRWAILVYADPTVGLVGYAAAQDYGPHLRAGRRHQGRLHDLYVSPAHREVPRLIFG